MRQFIDLLEETEPLAYLVEPHRFRQLKYICKELFDDGSILTSDKRRDLANLMHLILNEVRDLPYNG